MTITNLSIMLYIFSGVLGLAGLTAGIATLTVHNIVIGLCMIGLAVAGYKATKSENSF